MNGFSVINLVNYIYLLARASFYFWLLTIKFGLVKGTLMVQYFLQSKDRDNYSFCEHCRDNVREQASS